MIAKINKDDLEIILDALKVYRVELRKAQEELGYPSFMKVKADYIAELFYNVQKLYYGECKEEK